MAKNLEGTDQGAGLLAAMNRTLAPQQMTFDKEEKQRREAAGLTYTPVVQPTVWIWSRELVALVEEHSQGTTGPVSQLQSRSPSVLKKIQDEVVAVHRLIRDVPNNPQHIQVGDSKHQGKMEKVATFFNPALSNRPHRQPLWRTRCVALTQRSRCVKNRHILPAGAGSGTRG